MKFVSAVTALVAAMAVGSEAAKPKVSRRELKNRMKNGQFDKRTLMRGAKPHNEAAKKRRKLGNNMEITGDYSIQFKSCFSMTTSYDDMWEDNQNQGSATMNLFSSGQLMALESYAIFALYYMGNAEEYIIDLNTYVQSLVNYLPDQMEDYCEACEENWETCETMLYGQYGKRDDDMWNQQQQQNYYANSNNYNGNNANNVNYNYGNRKLSSIERVLQGGNGEVRQLDCGLCVEYNCVNDDDNQAEGMGYEDAAEWLTELAECKETGISYNGAYNANGYYQQQQGDEDAQLFAGMICNGDGSGIEIGMFYDEECKLYLPNEAYSNYMSYYDQTYQAMTKEVIEFTFSDAVLSCKDQEVIYTTQDLSNYNQYNGQNYNYEENADVAEWCEGVVMGENYPVDVNTCGNGYNYYNNNNGYAQQIDDDDQLYKLANYDWYRYEISEDNAYSMGVVCSTVKENGMHTFYNTANGNLYEYTGSVSEEVEEFLEDTGANVYSLGGLSGGAKFAIIAAVGIVIGAAVALYFKFQASTEDDKNVGLIDPEEVETKGGEVA